MSNKLPQEKTLRLSIRNAIRLSEVKRLKKIEQERIQESKLRNILRNIIIEVATDAEDDPHPKTGINFLRELFKQTNVLKTLRSAYKSLTTSGEQRKSFRAHVITWVVDTLAPLEATEMAGPPIKQQKDDSLPDIGALQEQLGVDVVTDDERAMSLMDELPGADGADDEPEEVEKTPEEEKEEEEQEEFPQLEGFDTTGRNVAKRIYKVIEKSIVQYYNEIGREDVEDRELYRDYLIANLKLYFDKWENEVRPSVEEPTNDEYEASKGNIQDKASGDPLAGSGESAGGIPDLDSQDIKQ